MGKNNKNDKVQKYIKFLAKNKYFIDLKLAIQRAFIANDIF